MNAGKKPVVFTTILVIVSLSLGASLMLNVKLYGAYRLAQDSLLHLRKSKDVQTVIDTYARLVTVLAIDQEAGVVLAETRDALINESSSFIFFLTNETTIEQHTPVIEDGVVVGFHNEGQATADHISVGDSLFVRLMLDSEQGRFIGLNIAIGDPFPRP